MKRLYSEPCISDAGRLKVYSLKLELEYDTICSGVPHSDDDEHSSLRQPQLLVHWLAAAGAEKVFSYAWRQWSSSTMTKSMPSGYAPYLRWIFRHETPYA